VAVGLITEASQAEEILQRGDADLIAIARIALYDPYWPLRAALTLGTDPGYGMWPPQYGWWLERWARTVAKHPCKEGLLAPVLKALGNRGP
jgi:2,4-dienoyl-CoA reductase-like NADH-dependent reductase (Old Yellow Enzyme family)